MAYQNFYATKTQNAIGASDNTIEVQTPPSATSGRLVLEPRNAQLREIISYTGVAGTTLTGVTRGLYGTSAQPHNSGVLLEMNLLAQDITDIYDAFNSFSSTNGGGWYSIPQPVTLTATNGNNSFNIQIAGDQTGVLSKGMRLRIPRTIVVTNQSTLLNGTNQYWNKSAPAGMTFTDDFAVGGWIYVPSYPATFGIIASRYNGTSGWSLYINQYGQIGLQGMNGGAANFSQVMSTQSVPLNRWVHVAAQLDMSAFTATPTTSYIMLDGVDVPVALARGGTNPTSLVQAGNLEIGSWNGGLLPFAGALSNVWVASAKITQANVRNFAYAGISPAVVAANNIVSAYSFAGNSTDINTVNANNLTGQNGATATNANAPFNTNAYAIIMTTPTLSGGNTTMTVQAANGYSIPNATLGAISYSAVKIPNGFPSEPNKWTIATYVKIEATSVVVAARTWTTTNLYGLNLPAGNWNLGYQYTMTWVGASRAYPVMQTSLAVSGGTKPEWQELNVISSGGSVAFTAWRDWHACEANVDNPSQRTLVPMYRAFGAGTVGATVEDDGVTIIYAENGYL